MKILIGLTYYRPHISGVTVYAERLAKAFAARGHQVTILTSQYRKDLPRHEEVNGLHIIRVPVLFRISKGVIMPGIGLEATRQIRAADVVLLHLPQFDAAGMAIRGKLFKKPTVLTYHCDLDMPAGFLSRIANVVVNFMNNIAAKFAHGIVTYTRDYAENSPYLSRYLDKVHVIQPPVEIPQATQVEIERFHQENNPENRSPVIGMAARFASEKGVEVLVNAMPAILKVYPNASVHFARPLVKEIGEEKYFKKLMPLVEDYERRGHWKFFDGLSPEQMAAFYPNIDVLVISSLNSTESFGLVQIEAMINAVPVVVSNLPGVRQPVKTFGMGKVVPIGDSSALAKAIIEILKNRKAFIQPADPIREEFIPDTVAQEYESLFASITEQIKNA
jgi:glycosyltransferase involved in cell wall biosynthesis